MAGWLLPTIPTTGSDLYGTPKLACSCGQAVAEGTRETQLPSGCRLTPTGSYTQDPSALPANSRWSSSSTEVGRNSVWPRAALGPTEQLTGRFSTFSLTIMGEIPYTS